MDDGMKEARSLRLRSLRGARMSVMGFLLIEGGPMSISALARISSYTDKPILQACLYLEGLGFAEPRGGGWRLTERGRLMLRELWGSGEGGEAAAGEVVRIEAAAREVVEVRNEQVRNESGVGEMYVALRTGGAVEQRGPVRRNPISGRLLGLPAGVTTEQYEKEQVWKESVPEAAVEDENEPFRKNSVTEEAVEIEDLMFRKNSGVENLKAGEPFRNNSVTGEAVEIENEPFRKNSVTEEAVEIEDLMFRKNSGVENLMAGEPFRKNSVTGEVVEIENESFRNFSGVEQAQTFENFAKNADQDLIIIRSLRSLDLKALDLKDLKDLKDLRGSNNNKILGNLKNFDAAREGQPAQPSREIFPQAQDCQADAEREKNIPEKTVPEKNIPEKTVPEKNIPETNDAARVAALWDEFLRLGLWRNERTIALAENPRVRVDYVRALAAKMNEAGKGGCRNSGLFIKACETQQYVDERYYRMVDQEDRMMRRGKYAVQDDDEDDP